MTKYTIYKITNKINNKIYIGCHRTSDLNDGYMGSGKLIRYAIIKYGVENFKKDYLHIFNNSEEMFNMEATLVNEEFVADKNTYNLKEGGFGGFGGFDHIDPKASIKVHTDRLKNDAVYAKWFSKIVSDAMKEWYKTHTKINGFLGKKHSNETKARISASHKGKHIGKLNSQYGMMWITNEVISKKIKKTDSIPEGFRKGRIIKVDK